jgi:hypothetical protein
MKKTISVLAILTLMLVTFSTNSEASVVRGKRYYVQLLKEPCGFKGDVMGKYHTKKEWRDAYMDGTLAIRIKEICPKAPAVISKKKQKHIYHFVSSFASDSGNVPSCN